jgi:hypothetical protein
MNTKTIRKMAKIFLTIFILIVLYVGLLDYQLYAANKEAAYICALAIVGENIDTYKNDLYKKMGIEVEYFDKGRRFNSFASLAFGVATCEIKIEGEVIVSKEFHPTFGG